MVALKLLLRLLPVQESRDRGGIVTLPPGLDSSKFPTGAWHPKFPRVPRVPWGRQSLALCAERSLSRGRAGRAMAALLESLPWHVGTAEPTLLPARVNSWAVMELQ